MTAPGHNEFSSKFWKIVRLSYNED